MDYPQLNLILGLLLITTLVINIGARVLLSKVRLSVGLSVASWTALIVSILSALYIEFLFLRLMTPSFNKQIAIGLLIIGGIGALVVRNLYGKGESQSFVRILFLVQILASLISVLLAFGLYRSMVPI